MFDHFKAAWPIVKANLVGFIIFGIVFMLVNGFTFGILMPNAFRAIDAAIERQEAPAIGDLFSFDTIVDDLVHVLIQGVGISLGTIACVVGAPIMALLLIWMPQLAADRKFAAVDAAKASLFHAKGMIGGIVMFFIAAWLVNFAGALACGVGSLVTLPMTMVAMRLFYKANADAIMANAQAQGIPTKA
jgi:hypothetical protein